MSPFMRQRAIEAGLVAVGLGVYLVLRVLGFVH